MKPLVLALVIVGSYLLIAQERSESVRDKERDTRPTAPPTRNLGVLTERLKQSLNGKAVVHNKCVSQGHEFEVEESTNLGEIKGCQLIFETRKTSTAPQGQRKVQFTIHVNLADLTTPPSIESKNFPQCQPIGPAIVKVMSPAEPGKKLRTTRRMESSFPGEQESSNLSEKEITRNDLSFFFSNFVDAKKAARALEHAIKACGGKEWPDEDDLP
jgi:hypothetical protein